MTPPSPTTLVQKSSVRHCKRSDSYSFKIIYFNKGNRKRLSVTYVHYATEKAAKRDCDRLADIIENTGMTRGFKPCLYKFRVANTGIP